ncbi:hypothetical protein D9M73_87580 [compost metagenome]
MLAGRLVEQRLVLRRRCVRAKLREVLRVERDGHRPRCRRQAEIARFGHSQRAEDRLRRALRVGIVIGQCLGDHAGIGGDIMRIGKRGDREPGRDLAGVGAGGARVDCFHLGVGVIVIGTQPLAAKEGAGAVGKADIAIHAKIVGLRAVRLRIGFLPIVKAITIERMIGRVGDVPFAEIMRRIAGLAHPGAERRNAAHLQPREIGRIAIFEQAIGLGDAGLGAILPGIEDRATRRARTRRDRVVAQHHRVAPQPQQARKELGIGVGVVDFTLETEDLFERLDEPAIRTIAKSREAVLITGNQQNIGARR